jgi:DNA-binding PadR family transcriptional regulator
MLNKENYITKGYRNEVLKLVLLTHLSRKEGYPYDLFKKMQSRKIWFLRGVVKSDFYNALNSLEKHGYIKGKIIIRGSHARKNYTVTAEGKRMLKAAKIAMIKSLVDVTRMMGR